MNSCLSGYTPSSIARFALDCQVGIAASKCLLNAFTSILILSSSGDRGSRLGGDTALIPKYDFPHEWLMTLTAQNLTFFGKT
jgi:hypothetical protein